MSPVSALEEDLEPQTLRQALAQTSFVDTSDLLRTLP